MTEKEIRAWIITYMVDRKINAYKNLPELRFNPYHDDKGRFTTKEGNVLTNGGNNDTIRVRGKVMYRKKSSEKVEPMPKKQFRNIVKAFKKHGGIIQTDALTDDYLKRNHAEGITLNKDTILLKQNPGRASVFEELIHTEQYRNGRNDGSERSRLLNEIEAQKKLIKFSKNYKLTANEIKQTENALKKYEDDLKAYDKLHGGG